eukprot:CAMPEP_0175184456 /NCGR_PEP_ID=MMETSP0093-20121207/1375_1 /TAXON_ID=311494 /ORGANISM="Alexandrium monilatum, Strain CCMP3105" /LENGTH=749 /DNA_ID=CAMNT_0016477127 /DNA_START=13 /DNA_END=2262 /DNA_ORIENTATION=+
MPPCCTKLFRRAPDPEREPSAMEASTAARGEKAACQMPEAEEPEGSDDELQSSEDMPDVRLFGPGDAPQVQLLPPPDAPVVHVVQPLGQRALAGRDVRPPLGPFGAGSRIGVCVHGACLMGGSLAVLSDLEDLCRHTAVQLHVASRGCLGLCGQGPNCLLEPPAHAKGRTHVQTGVRSFEASVSLLKKALDSGERVAAEPVLRRARLKSDAMRLMHGDLARPSEQVAADMLRAEELLTEAIDLEQNSGDRARLLELLLMRGKARGRCALADAGRRHAYAELAVTDFGAVTAEEPQHARAHLETARVLDFTRRPKEALDSFQRSLDVSKGPALRDWALGPGEMRQVERSMQRILRRLEEAAAAGVEHVEADGERADSGDGSGRWKVARITGISWDTCVYHLENSPPAEPHPCPSHSWHVQARFGAAVRDYTPVSTVAQWEAGRVDLLVKTYSDGVVSKQFGALRTVDEAQAACQVSYEPLEDQRCWVTISRPLVTLHLPSLTEAPAPLPAAARPDGPVRLALIVGGTGVAPALQLLNEVAEPNGSFGPHATAVMIYSSRTVLDVLMLNELRALEASAAGRISVRHTLTNAREGDEDEDPWESLPQQVYFPGRHGHFLSFFNQPPEPIGGPLRRGRGGEAELRGRLNPEMLAGLLPPPGPSTKAVVCGPQQMLDDVGAMLLRLGHAQDAVVLLHATTSSGQDTHGSVAEGPCELAKAGAGTAAPLPVISVMPAPEANAGSTFADRVRAAQG